jgi:hypothetical protein
LRAGSKERFQANDWEPPEGLYPARIAGARGGVAQSLTHPTDRADRCLGTGSKRYRLRTGGLYSKQLQDAQNAVLSDPETPFRYYFIPDGKSIHSMFPDTTITGPEKTLSWGKGMTSKIPKQIKLFADGAIYSQLMQMDFANAFRVYRDAGYRIHIHVTGDAGIDRVLDNVEANMRRDPRYDHRTVHVHFSVSQKDQIKRLGAIVGGNPYYVTMPADRYSEEGLGPERAVFFSLTPGVILASHWGDVLNWKLGT